jgi:glycosyltransferase involved in cell wall biosynthesis
MAETIANVKFALVSHVLPPSSSGQAVVLYRLLRDCDPAAYCLISVRDYEQSVADPALDCVTQRLTAPYYRLPPETHWRFREATPCRWGRRAVGSMLRLLRPKSPGAHEERIDIGEGAGQDQSVSTVAGGWQTKLRSAVALMDDSMYMRRHVRRRARAILRIVEREKCAAIVACSGDTIDIPAAFLASQWGRVAFYPYMFDDYAWQWPTAFQCRYAQGFCPRMMRAAARVVVPNEFLAQTYRDVYEVDPVIVPNPIEAVSPLAGDVSRREGEPLRIVYTGAVYQAHFDAFANLLRVLGRFPANQVQLHIYTSCDARFLASHGVGAPAQIHPQVTTAQAQELQKSADVLFLPLAFSSPIPNIVRTSAPGKMGELLASGRPILVHAPQDCFVSWYCRQHECAAVVDELDPGLLQRTLARLLEDRVWSARLARNAWQRARTDFGLNTARERFFQLFSQQIEKR